MLTLKLQHRFAKFSLDVGFRTQGKLTVLFGPSGCGKTTLIKAIAGLVRPDEGTITLDGETLCDTAQRIWVPPHKRRIATVFQDARLLPHLSVAQNLRYGRWFTKPSERYMDAHDVLGMLALTPLMDRKPDQLSGGERQRVALGRALLQSPRLLLMDEPLASLDEARKTEILPFIERLRDEHQVPIIYVSHSLREVARLAGEVVLLKAGRLEHFGSAEDILPKLALMGEGFEREGGSMITAIITTYESGTDLTHLNTPGGQMIMPGRGGDRGQKIILFIRASDVLIATRKPEGLSALNILPGTVASLSPTAQHKMHVALRCGQAMITALITQQAVANLNLQIGSPVFAVIKAVSLQQS